MVGPAFFQDHAFGSHLQRASSHWLPHHPAHKEKCHQPSTAAPACNDLYWDPEFQHIDLRQMGVIFYGAEAQAGLAAGGQPCLPSNARCVKSSGRPDVYHLHLAQISRVQSLGRRPHRFAMGRCRRATRPTMCVGAAVDWRSNLGKSISTGSVKSHFSR